MLLDVGEDGWPPVAAESIWVRYLPEHTYEVLTSPFFISGMAMGDVIDITSNEPWQVDDWTLTTGSRNSTIWMLVPGEMELCSVFDTVSAVYPGEQLPEYRLISLVLTEQDTLDAFDKVIETIDPNKHLHIACPALRHEEK